MESVFFANRFAGKKGKPKLTRDEASKLLAWFLAHPHDEGAIPTAMAFLLGMRASEIVTRTRTTGQKKFTHRLVRQFFGWFGVNQEEF